MIWKFVKPTIICFKNMLTNKIETLHKLVLLVFAIIIPTTACVETQLKWNFDEF